MSLSLDRRLCICLLSYFGKGHGLRTPREEIAFTARPKIQSQIFRYGQSIFCLPHRPNFSDIFDLCLHRVSVVGDLKCHIKVKLLSEQGCVSLSTNFPSSGKMQRGAQVNKSDLCSNWLPKIRQADWARKHR